MCPERDAPGWSSPGVPVAVVAGTVFAWLVPGGPGFHDAGELGAAAQSLGVPHPTGFPIDMLLLRAATFAPLGSIAFRQNLVVALVAAGALGLLAEVTATACRGAGLPPRAAALGGAFAALVLSCWATFLGTALTVEVYSTALFLALVGVLVVLRTPATCLRPLGLLVGLAASAHVVARPFLAALWLWAALRDRQAPRRLAASLGLAAVGAASVAYLPLASRRDPPLDWGDPETAARIWEHLTAGRIRGAFADAMWNPHPQIVAHLLGQLLELWPALLLGAVGLAWAMRRKPLLGLVPLLVAVGDLGYAVAVHPMGIEGRQVGHGAGAALCFLGGVGLAAAWDRARSRVGQLAVAASAAGLGLVALLGAPRWVGADPEVAGELYGSGGSLTELPPRAVAVCGSDDVCAGALFALHAEGARPDVVVVPAQHLWEPNVRARVASCFAGGDPALGQRPASAAERAALAQRAADRLGAGAGPCEVFWEGGAAVRPTAVPLVAGRHAPWLTPEVTSPTALRLGLRALVGAYRARVPSPPAVTSDGRAAWSRTFEAVGRGALEAGSSPAAVDAFQLAVEAAPERAVAWSNLAVARARMGDLPGAVDAADRAVELGPDRPTARVNQVQFRLAAGDREGAVRALEAALQAGIEDPRLRALARDLRGSDRLPK